MRTPIIAILVATATIASAQTPAPVAPATTAAPVAVVPRRAAPAQPETRTTDLAFVVNGWFDDGKGVPLPGLRLSYRPVGSPIALQLGLNSLLVATQLEAGVEVRFAKGRTTPYLFGRGGVFFAMMPKL